MLRLYCGDYHDNYANLQLANFCLWLQKKKHKRVYLPSCNLGPTRVSLNYAILDTHIRHGTGEMLLLLLSHEVDK